MDNLGLRTRSGNVVRLAAPPKRAKRIDYEQRIFWIVLALVGVAAVFGDKLLGQW